MLVFSADFLPLLFFLSMVYNPIFDSIKAENPANMGFFRFFQYFKM